MNKRLVLALGLAGCGIIGSAAASTTYVYSSGAVDVTLITVGSTTVFSGGDDLPLSSGSTATLDSPTAPTQFGFLFGDQGGSIALSGSETFGSKNSTTLNFSAATLSLSSSVDTFSLQTISNLGLTSTGGGNYSFNSGISKDVQITGTASISGLTASVNGGTPTSVSVPAVGFGPNDQPISGTLGLASGGADLSINGVTLGTLTVDGQAVTIDGDIVFNGVTPVPLPPSLWLLGSALGLLGFFARARRNSNARVAW